jgi:hypothetical protein
LKSLSSKRKEEQRSKRDRQGKNVSIDVLEEKCAPSVTGSSIPFVLPLPLASIYLFFSKVSLDWNTLNFPGSAETMRCRLNLCKSDFRSSFCFRSAKESKSEEKKPFGNL